LGNRDVAAKGMEVIFDYVKALRESLKATLAAKAAHEEAQAAMMKATFPDETT
jgi:hypothetical protein